MSKSCKKWKEYNEHYYWLHMNDRGMSKFCKRCKEYAEHHYWLHTNDQEKYFFKVMMGNFQHRMIIPKKFAENFCGQTSKVIKLEVPNGNKCNVQLTKEPNNLVLGSGWSAFCSAHDLQQYDFLVFRYIGNSCFKVLIFDLSGCQKVSSCVSMKNTPDFQERSEDSVETLNIHHDGSTQSPRSRRSLRHQCGGSSRSRKTARMTPTDSPSWKSTEEASSSEDMMELVNSGGVWTCTKSHYVLARRCCLTVAQKAEVHALEKKIQPKIPLYVTAMNTSAIRGYLGIRADYADEHLPQEDQTITLSQPSSSKTWDVKFHIDMGGRHVLSAGWSGFVTHNKLQVGDICIFEVSEGNIRVTMKVHIVKGSRHPPEDVQSSGSPSSESAGHGVTQHEYMVSRFTSLTYLQKRKVEERVRAIQSEVPIFVAVMWHSNVDVTRHCILSFSLKYAVKYLPREEQIMRLRRPGKNSTWNAEFLIRNNVHKLCQGWRQFVIENHVQQGDICLFQLMTNKMKLTMNVYIIRK